MRVLLDGNNGQLHRHAELWVCDVCLFVSQTHGPDEPLVLDGASGEIGTDESGLGDHSLPALLGSLLSGLDDLEHLLLGDTPDLGKWDGELCGLFITLVLDGRGQGLGVLLLRSVEQVGGQRGVGRLGGLVGLDVALLVGLDLLLHLDLLLVALLLVQLGPQTAQVLCIFGLLVAFTGGALALALFMIEAATMLLGEAFHVLILRHGGGIVGGLLGKVVLYWTVLLRKSQRRKIQSWSRDSRECGEDVASA